MNELRVLGSAAVIALSLAAAGCGGSATETTGATETTPPSPTTATSTTTEQPQPSVTTVRIVVKDGKVVGGLRRTTVTKGDKVAIAVSSDVADEVHLHGYDKMVDVAPGKPIRILFVATLPGRFEVELESRGLQIADLEVRP